MTEATDTDATTDDALQVAQTALATAADVEEELATLRAQTGQLAAEVALLEDRLDRRGR